nr:hydantoinase B/oxoprolinase family protein [Betaproteobacteria bacterium]
DHGRVGPQGALGGADGGVNRVTIEQQGKTYRPPHLSKDQAIVMQEGDRIHVSTPGGGGYGDPRERDAAAIAQDLARGYYTPQQIEDKFGAAVSSSPRGDATADLGND